MHVLQCSAGIWYSQAGLTDTDKAGILYISFARSDKAAGDSLPVYWLYTEATALGPPGFGTRRPPHRNAKYYHCHPGALQSP